MSPPATNNSLKKPVCVFCGSSPGNSSIYAQAATSLGQALAKANIPVIYGGGRKGIMGVVSNATSEAGGYVHGVLPRALLDSQMSAQGSSSSKVAQSGEGVGEDVLVDNHGGRVTMEIVEGMHERKAKMAELATGGFIVLPGGYGTFEEVLEMITWNQLGIHRLPILILNIGNFYSSLLTLFHKAVSAGFIQEANLSLMRIVNLEGGESDNDDPGKAGSWGEAAIRALDEWKMDDGAGYGFKWKGKDELENKDGRNPLPKPTPSDYTEPAALFTTLRYTTPDVFLPTIPVEKRSIPLLDRHIRRLKNAHQYFSDRDGENVWGKWAGDEAVWDKLKAALEAREEEDRVIGDWRVRLIYKPHQVIQVETFRAPPGPSGSPFVYSLSSRQIQIRPMILDPEDTDPSEETSAEIDYRMYKTVQRGIYDQASARAAKLHPDIPGVEILLHTSTHILETATSNIAIQTQEGTWITPILDREKTPFLAGVMRGYLLDKGEITEGEVSVQDILEARKDGRRVIGFNGLRGVWEAELI